VNYRHAFHAGNFADLVKHAALLRLLDRLLADAAPLTVIDTHAGAGRYDLTDEEQARSREAEAGVARLMDGSALPKGLDDLARHVRAQNPGGAVKVYDGSPALILDRLRSQDRFIACELRPDDHARLAKFLGKRGDARLTDGFAEATALAHKPGRLLVLIDPPFERADDYARIVETAAAVRTAKPEAVLLAWTPLKDLETLDAFVRRLEDAGLDDVLINETRLRRLTDPMRLNGCVLAAIGAPDGFADDLEAISGWVAGTLGEPGGSAKTWLAGGDDDERS
jgi:23S rRNA (adenine2030-N6)-methyltransferase